MYGQLVRPPVEFVAAAADYVCVRVTDMQGIDLNQIRFDFDLTLAVLLMNADGTVYHRYGGRDAADALSWMSLPSLLRVMRLTLAEHAGYQQDPSPPAELPERRVVDLPPLARRLQAAPAECIHCHTVNDTEHQWAVERGVFEREDQWVYPSPARVGLQLDSLEQERVVAVAPDSAAARAGLAVGDRLLRFGVQPRVRTIGDVQWALHRAPRGDTAIEFTSARGDEPERSGTLALAAGWKRTSPRDYAWRPYKWNLSPAPGFGGPALTVAAKAALGIAADKFAMRVDYLVTWGERAHRGRAARAAGVAKGDVVVSIGGRDDFASVDHFHAWVRLACDPGQVVEVVLLRDGERRSFDYALPK